MARPSMISPAKMTSLSRKYEDPTLGLPFREVLLISNHSEARGIVSELIGAFLRRLDAWRVPVPLEELVLPLLGVKVANVRSHVEGRVILEDDGFAIRLGTRHSASYFRRRFTLAHELAHILTLDPSEEVRRRLSSGTLGDRSAEHLCDIIAAEILMPGGLLRSAASSATGFEFQHFYDLADAFRVTAHAMALRITRDLEMCPAIVLGVSWATKPHGPARVWTWRYAWGAAPDFASDCVVTTAFAGRPKVRIDITERAFHEGGMIIEEYPLTKIQYPGSKALVGRVTDIDRVPIRCLASLPTGTALADKDTLARRLTRMAMFIVINPQDPRGELAWK